VPLVIVYDDAVDVKLSGPLQLYVSGAPDTGVAVTVILPPIHAAPEVVAVADGAGFTVTVNVYPSPLQLLEGTTVYVAVAFAVVVLTSVWLTEATGVFCAEAPVMLPAGDMTGAPHLYVVPAGRLVGVALNELLLHMVMADGACTGLATPMAKPCRPPACVEKLKLVGLLVETRRARALAGPVPVHTSVLVPIPVSVGTLPIDGGVIVS
jgi:hypothetical protein